MCSGIARTGKEHVGARANIYSVVCVQRHLPPFCANKPIFSLWIKHSITAAVACCLPESSDSCLVFWRRKSISNWFELQRHFLSARLWFVLILPCAVDRDVGSPIDVRVRGDISLRWEEDASCVYAWRRTVHFADWWFRAKREQTLNKCITEHDPSDDRGWEREKKRARERYSTVAMWARAPGSACLVHGVLIDCVSEVLEKGTQDRKGKLTVAAGSYMED